MTDKVIPSSKGDSNAYIVAQLVEHGAGTEGWIQDSSEALLADNDNDLDQNVIPLSAFNTSSASDSLTVTIDTGEAFVGGAWVARDVTTDVSLNASTSGQTVYLGWKNDLRNDILIGLNDGSTGDPGFVDQDQKIPIWTFDTDSSGVTSTNDERTIGKTSNLGRVTLQEDSEFGRWVGTAVDSVAGTAGNSNNEVFRFGSNDSDLIGAVTDGDGKFQLSYNAFNDGSDWRYIRGSEQAMRIEYDKGVKIHVAPTGSADAIVSWTTYHIQSDGGDLVAPGGTLWDDTNDHIPQSSLEGPPSQISSYPVGTSDIDDGEGSGLDADTLRGLTPAGITGEWQHIETIEDSDTTTAFDWTKQFDTLYDMYRLNIYFENPSPDTHHFMRLRLNNDASNSYRHVHIAADDRDIFKRTGVSNFHAISGAKTNNWAYDQIVIGCPTSTYMSSMDNQYPKVTNLGHNLRSFDSDGIMVAGELLNSYSSVDQFRLWTLDGEAAAKVELYGANI